MPFKGPAKAARETPFDQKLKDIAREKKRIEQEIKALARSVQKAEQGRPIAPRPTARPSSITPVSETRSETQPNRPMPKTEVHARPPEEGGGIKKTPPVRGDERFASYFATGGFKTPLPGRPPPPIQRNKRIFIGIVAVLLVYVLIALFRR